MKPGIPLDQPHLDTGQLLDFPGIPKRFPRIFSQPQEYSSGARTRSEPLEFWVRWELWRSRIFQPQGPGNSITFQRENSSSSRSKRKFHPIPKGNFPLHPIPFQSGTSSSSHSKGKFQRESSSSSSHSRGEFSSSSHSKGKFQREISSSSHSSSRHSQGSFPHQDFPLQQNIP